MPATLLHEDRQTPLPAAQADGDALWLSADEIARATGWAWKPEGLCRDEACVPIPREGGWVRHDGAEPRLDLARLWRRMGQPLARDAAGSAWAFGTGAAQHSDALNSLQVPDLGWPDLSGQRVRLADHRGKRVCLVTWASW